MKIGKITAVAIFAQMLFAASIFAAGSRDETQETRSWNLGSFTSIDVSGGIELDASYSRNFSVEISGSRSALGRLDVHVTQGVLHIGFKSSGFSWGGFGRVSAKVALPVLTAVSLSGGCPAQIKFDARSSVEVALDLSGGSRIAGLILGQSLKIAASGGSQVNLEGFADTLSLEASGGSRIDSKAFAVGQARIQLAGGSYAVLAIQDGLTLDASGGSKLEYRGQPAIKQDLSGGSAISHVD